MVETSELEQFQNFIDDLVLRNKSILDQMTKLQDASARLTVPFQNQLLLVAVLK